MKEEKIEKTIKNNECKHKWGDIVKETEEKPASFAGNPPTQKVVFYYQKCEVCGLINVLKY
jgi:hypothetical protein